MPIGNTTLPNLAQRNRTISISSAGLIVSGSVIISGSANTITLSGASNSATPATQTYVATQVSNLVDSAPAALDTLNELAAAIGDDANFATTISTGLGNRLRIDIASQGLTSTQQGYGRTNLGLGTAATTNATAYATAAQGANADTAYGWGNHASAGYLTSQTSHADVVVDGDFTSNGLMKRTGAGTYAIVTDNSSNWNTAYGWGNHASAGYLTSYTETDTLASITGRGATTSTLSTFDGGLNIGNAKLRWGGTTSPTLGFPFTGGPNGFWIDVNDGDTGGLAIDNDGTTIYGAGDSGHVFRVIDEDVYQATSNVDASTTFRIQQGQNGGGYLRGNFEITGTLTASGYNKTNWDTAFGWGNHASAGYLTSFSETDTLDSVTDRGATTTNTITVGTIVVGSGTYKNTISLNGDTNLNFSTPSGATFFDTYAEANGSFRAPIFFDSNDTSYYINPADSDVSAVLKGTVTIGGGTGGNYDEGLRIVDSSGYSVIVFGASGNVGAGRFNIVKTSGDTFQLRNNASTVLWETNQSGNTTFSTDLRTPIFYDSDDTGYYVNPASTSNLNTITLVDGNVELYKTQSVDLSNTGTYSTSNYYPVTISIGQAEPITIQIQNNLNSNAPSWSTHGSGFTLNVRWITNGSGWGTTDVKRKVYQYFENFTNSTICGGITQMTQSSTEVVWLRGGGVYNFRFSRNVTAIPRSTTYTVNGQSVSPTTSAQNGVWQSATGNEYSFITSAYVAGLVSAPVYYDSDNTSYYLDAASTSNLAGLTVVNTISGRISGFAAAGSSKLYSTDSSYNYDAVNPYYAYITYNGTANRWRFKVSPATPEEVEVSYADNAGAATSAATWTTGRTITIGNTGKTVNGSGDVAWSLSEIGAQATLTNPVTGTGTSTYIPKFNGTSTLTNSQIVDTGTYVGIGTTSPGALLQVGNANQSTDALVRLSIAYSSDRASRGGITWRDASNTTGKIYTEYDGTMTSMVFGSLYNSGYTSNQTMVIRGNGNVGIATTTPVSKLEVRGTTTFSADAYGYVSIIPTAGDGGTAYITQGTNSPRSGGNLAIRVNAYAAGGNFSIETNGTERFRITSAGATLITGSLTTTAGITTAVDVRSPIFYDSNNTSYYLDPTSTSYSSYNAGGARFRNIEISNSTYTDTIQNVTSGGNIWLNYGHNGNVGLAYGGGFTTAYQSMRSPIFYDSDNTGYYVDPASTSNVNTLYGTEIYANNWFRNVGSDEGLYNQVTTQHWSSNTNGLWDASSTTNATTGATGIRLYAGGHVNTLRGYLYSDGDGFGLLNNQGGWSVRANQGTGYGGQLYGSWQAPILYDSDNTNYYVDPASTSRLNNIRTWGVSALAGDGVGYGFWDGYGGSSYSIWMSSTSNGTYGGQVSGVGSNNDYNMYFKMAYNNRGFVFITGDSTPKVQIANEGLHVAGNIYTSTLYDRDDTGYYVDPAGVSVIGALVNGTNNSFILRYYFCAGGDYNYTDNIDYAHKGGVTSNTSYPNIQNEWAGETYFNGTVLNECVAGQDIDKGHLVYLRNNGKWMKADAIGASTSTLLLGIALKTATTDGTLSILLNGIINVEHHAQNYTATPGLPLYVATSNIDAPGYVTQDAPTATGEVVRLIGHNIIDNASGRVTIKFNPDNTWIEL